jgi:uncharacterized protein (TIGR02246 family)
MVTTIRAQNPAVRAERPDDLHRLFAEGVNSRDVEALLRLYEQDAAVVDLTGSVVRDEPALRAFLTGFVASVRRIEGETRKVFVAGDLALMSSAWRAELVAGDGGAATATGTTAEVARRQPDGSWRFVIDDPQFPAPPAQHPATST